ncbi:AraC family transcriptional regulator [Paenibacillus puerhi]|uniref:AraC family transcriptional regulator n=1 Tax=Paenibacillus puerhi TaxID=2692622 RepID=UPI001356EC06|nr:AraC family transcriptional regulator [Paenibacillus puerhi]
MKVMRRMNTVFANLAISYLTIVIIVVLLLCSIFYMIVPRNYNEEIRSKNQLMLKNAAHTMESAVVERVNKIYLDMTLGKTLNIDAARGSFQGQTSTILDIQDLLKQKVITNSDLVHAIHLYYPGTDVMISSLYGLKYGVDTRSEVYQTMGWIDRLQRAKSSYLWTEPRMVPQDIYASVSGSNRKEPLITYAHSYPFNSAGEGSDLMIGIDIKESAFSGILRQMMPADYPNTYLIDQQGTVMSAADKTLLGGRAAEPARIANMLASQADAQSYNETIEDTDYVVSHHKLPSTGWKIYNVIQENSFYEKSIVLQKVILLICLLAILIGMVLSGVFTVVSYSPIKRLMSKIKGLFDHPSETRHNEYALIDTAIHKLSSKVSSLEETLQANKPVIKHNVVLNMLRNGYKADELEEQLLSLNLSMDFSSYCCMVIDPVSKGFRELGSKANQYAMYKLINQLEAAGMEEAHLIAEELPDRKIVVIVCAHHPKDALLESISNQILVDVKAQFGLDFKIAWGIWEDEWTGVHRSFAAAQILIKYGFFFPEASIIREFSLLNREHSHLEIPQSVLLKFKEKLQARSLDGVTVAIDNLLRELKEGTYAADYGQFMLRHMISMYADFLKNTRFKHAGPFQIDVYKQYHSIYDIHNFREWLVSSIAECYGHLEKRSDERAMDSIEAVKHYICSHLSEDLSLDAVAAKVFLSPKYLSKIFKEETGIGYTEFVTQKRMEGALELMKNNSLTVEQIASAVGYGTPAYFIKKFKEMNGCTPKHYVRSMLKHG